MHYALHYPISYPGYRPNLEFICTACNNCRDNLSCWHNRELNARERTYPFLIHKCSGQRHPTNHFFEGELIWDQCTFQFHLVFFRPSHCSWDWGNLTELDFQFAMEWSLWKIALKDPNVLALRVAQTRLATCQKWHISTSPNIPTWASDRSHQGEFHWFQFWRY